MKNLNRNLIIINSENRSFEKNEVPLNVCKNFLGGRGIASYYMSDSINYSWNHPESKFLIFNNPIPEGFIPLSSGLIVMGKSPMTGGVMSANIRGDFSLYMKIINILGIIITGKFENLVGIHIDKDGVFFQDIDKKYTENIFNKKFQEAYSFLRVKEAAFNNVYFANLSIDNIYYGGRGGLGTILGNKNILYIAIEKHSLKKKVYSDKLIKNQDNVLRLIYANPVLTGESGFLNFGTLSLLHLVNERRMLPFSNFKKTYIKKNKLLNPVFTSKKFVLLPFSCSFCPIKCMRINKNILFDYDSISAFMQLTNYEKTIKSSILICSEKGLDPISAAGTIATYKENNKKITDRMIIDILTDISLSKGIGNVLKFGSYHYADKINNIDSSMTVKKLEIPLYDPRGAYGLSLSYAVSSKGPQIEDAYLLSNEILRKPVALDRFSFEGKARILKRKEDEGMIFDALGLCYFLKIAISLDLITTMLNEFLDTSFSSYDLKLIGERIYYNERILNFISGLKGEDDTLPKRFFKDDGSGSFFNPIPKLSETDFLKEKLNYYKIRKLDINGNPLNNEAKKLKLNF